MESCPTLLSLPAELRIMILEHVFQDLRSSSECFIDPNVPGGIVLNHDYRASVDLQPLFVCRTLYHDGYLLALNRTSFVCASIFSDVPQRLSLLHPMQVAAIRSIAFLADQRQFRNLRDWNQHAFGVSGLRLDTLTLVLHRSSPWHYLNDFTHDVVKLLRELRGVRRFVFVQNTARVKGSFRTWYNRLVGLIMKQDHHERYNVVPPNPEKCWWEWSSYDDKAHTFQLDAKPPRPSLDEEAYMTQMVPLTEALKLSIESEPWNPDPRSRTMYY